MGDLTGYRHHTEISGRCAGTVAVSPKDRSPIMRALLRAAILSAPVWIVVGYLVYRVA